MADTRAADNYSHVDVVSGNVIASAHENLEGAKVETSINQANSMLLDLEDNYASATAPTSTEDGKVWYDSGDGVLKYYKGSDWTQLNIYDSKASKDTDYAILSSDFGKIIDLSATVAATFTLPSVGADEDGAFVSCSNSSDYNLVVTPSDTDAVWNSGWEYGIELPDKGTMVTLRYDHANTKWDIVHKVGGRVLIEGLKLSVTMGDPPGLFDTSDLSSGTYTMDERGKHALFLSGRIQFEEYAEGGAVAKYPPGCFEFGRGDADFGYLVDSTDWDIFGDQTGHKTVAGWVYFDGLGTAEYICSQYEDESNRWHINKLSSNKLTFVYETATSVEVNISAVSSFSIATWHHVAVVFNGLEIGIYLDGEQENYDTAWNADTFLGSLYFGQKGDDTGWFDGRMQDWHISYNNPYNAAPNVAVNDTFTVPAAPAQLVMK